MTLAERCQLLRAEEQSRFPFLGRTAKRFACSCGCGVWFYWEPGPGNAGRPPRYVNHEHKLRARRAREKSKGWA